MKTFTRISRGLVSCAFILSLAGCGGSTVGPVFFEGPVTDADYVGKSFPVFFLLGETGDPTGNTFAGQGSITYNSDGTLTLNLNRSAPVELVSTGTSGLGETYEGTFGGATVSVLVTDFASTEAFRLASIADTDIGLLGGFGFETAVDDRPAAGTYTTAGAVFLTAENVGAILPAAGSGTLEADFVNGNISGTLLDADVVQVELAGDIASPDDLALMFMLENGVITDNGFSGGVSVSGELVVDGTTLTPLNTVVTGDAVSGTFYGDGAEVVAGIFESEVELLDGSDSLIDLGADGFLSGGLTPP